MRRSGLEALALPDVTFSDLIGLAPGLADTGAEIQAQLEREAVYAGYLERQAKDVAALKRDEARAIPEDFDFASMSGLSVELRDKLSATRPGTLAQAARIDGMTPAALTLILARLQRAARRAAG